MKLIFEAKWLELKITKSWEISHIPHIQTPHSVWSIWKLKRLKLDGIVATSG